MALFCPVFHFSSAHSHGATELFHIALKKWQAKATKFYSESKGLVTKSITLGLDFQLSTWTNKSVYVSEHFKSKGGSWLPVEWSLTPERLKKCPPGSPTKSSFESCHQSAGISESWTLGLSGLSLFLVTMQHTASQSIGRYEKHSHYSWPRAEGGHCVSCDLKPLSVS